MLPRQPHRRQFLQGLGALTGSSLLAPSAIADSGPERRYLLVIGAFGGASIVDGPLAIRASESANPDALNTFADAQVVGFNGSPLRAVDQSFRSLGAIPMGFGATQADFVRAHHHDMMVATWTRTSVNHGIGQRRSVTGNEAWGGRTLQELFALHHGEGLLIPNAHLVTGSGYTDRGTDDTLPAWAFGEPVTDPSVWPLALDALAGGPTRLTPSLLAKARAIRNQRFDPATPFHRVMGNSPDLAHWDAMRRTAPALEAADLVRRLMVFRDSPELPLGAYGLSPSPDAERVHAAFPAIDNDPLAAQAALGFLLLKYGVSASVTLGPTADVSIPDDVEIDVLAPQNCDGEAPEPVLAEGAIANPPLAFDFSHQAHRGTQAFMWSRLYGVLDGLIGLLKAEDYGDGTSMWDHTVVYIASDFGRTRTRPSGAREFSSGHHVNNGVLVVSPLANGNTVLGGVDPDTALTYGFDPISGAPEPGREMSEAEIFSGLLGVCGVSTTGAGLPSVPAMSAV